ncbi:MAG: FAD-binding oxidoreductase [Geminicoccaceae bacterium]|nr:MAG: FAD-binding oxidoreductase [Geminicoccaceae bacterium]
MTAEPRPQPTATAPTSWYALTAAALPDLPRLEGAIAADVAVVGAGFTGLSAALHLALAGRRVVVLEADRVGAGASGVNGGQLCTGMRLDQDELEASLGVAPARGLWAMAEAAKALVHDLARAHGIAYGYRPGLLHVAHKRRYVDAYRRYAAKLQDDYGYAPIRFVGPDALPELLTAAGYFGGTYDAGAGHLHPLAFVRGLASRAIAAGAQVFEQSPATTFETTGQAVVTVKTGAGTVRAEQLILATNGQLDQLAPKAASATMPINNFMVATAPLGGERAAALIPSDAAVADSRFVVSYFRRSHDHRLLFGGGETYGYGLPADIGALVRPHLERVFPQLRGVALDHGWGGTVRITRSRLPHFARLRPNVLSAGGYSGQGVALATFAGKLMADAVIGQGDGFDRLAALPIKPFPGGRRARWPLLALAMSWYALRDRL